MICESWFAKDFIQFHNKTRHTHTYAHFMQFTYTFNQTAYANMQFHPNCIQFGWNCTLAYAVWPKLYTNCIQIAYCGVVGLVWIRTCVGWNRNVLVQLSFHIDTLLSYYLIIVVQPQCHSAYPLMGWFWIWGFSILRFFSGPDLKLPGRVSVGF